MDVITLAQVRKKEPYLKDIRAIFFANNKTNRQEQDRRLAHFVTYYVENYPDYFYCLVENNRVLAYICICPNTYQALDDIPYRYYHAFYSEYKQHPAHMHINVDPKKQGEGLGARLFSYVKEDFQQPLHVITFASHQNHNFYKKVGFSKVTTKNYEEKLLVMLSSH